MQGAFSTGIYISLSRYQVSEITDNNDRETYPNLHDYVAVNLSQVGNQEDSSSEDTSSNGNGGKPALPPRPRSISIDHSSAR